MCTVCFCQSSGELENDEHTAGVIMQMVRTACRFRLYEALEPSFKRMSGKINSNINSKNNTVPYFNASLTLFTVMFEDYVYVVTISGQKVVVVKRQNNQRDLVTV